MVQATNVKSLVLDYFLREVTEGRDVDPAEDLFADGQIDSLKIVGVIGFVESEFGLVIEDDDFEISNFSSVNAVCALIENRAQLS
ncbi:acyl carrier protein [Blastococcus sp. CCUG 61487]|uniref:acyl carrier protein n=1 Tax=Blastococcus sp. CCUG 61487 TaxID=1840703 RepID=UPI0010C0BE57|nr:acyl carrier protein [Blastococcus sp. CCUG 61487]TKJ21336.1 hypothetical protein A6V29_07625 [Blastococcus sp. CCUG 61487]